MADQTTGNDPVIYDQNRLTADDLYLFNEGSHFRLYDKLGAKTMTVKGMAGTHFAVWAPDASEVFVIGDFNGWNKSSHPLRPSGQAGIWEGFIPGIGQWTCYKYHIVSRYNGYRVDKTDPFGSFHERSPRTGSVVWDLAYEWNDQDWMSVRGERHHVKAPVSIYEMHFGSWRRKPEEDNRRLNYREIAPLLAEHIKGLNFTHVEFLPIMEHPFYGSWGYQTTGFSRPPAGTAHLRILCTWWIICIRTG